MFATPLRADAELRPLEPHHAEEFFAHIERARTHIAPWVGPSFVASNLDAARNVLQRYQDDQAADKRRIYGIWHRGRLVGGTMFVKFDTKSGVCELGCWLEPSAEGLGLMTPVIRMMLDWAFRERGLVRAEWNTVPTNVRSIALAKRVGMTLEGTMRKAYPGTDGTRRDNQLYAVLADEWSLPPDPVKAELDELVRRFFAAFTNTDGAQPDLEVIRELFIPEGRIIKNIGGQPVHYDLNEFIAPRRQILTDGTLTEFAEWETAERTEIEGTVAHRFSHYSKSGRLHGEAFEGSGHKTTQFLRTPDGWRMSSMAWDDAN